MTITLHPQVLTAQGFLVDEEMYPLLRNLWAHGFVTCFSCQGGYMPDHGDLLPYIWFDHGQR